MTIDQLKELLQRYLTGKATDEELQIVERWFHRSEEKEYFLSEEKRQEVAARLLPRLRTIAHPEEGYSSLPAEHLSENKGRFFIFIRRWQRVAAVLLLLFGVSAIIYRYRITLLDRIDPVPQQTVIAGPYEIRSVILPDSSRAVLKSGSRITYPVRYRGGERRVSMEGVVFYNVSKDPSSVFTVHSTQMDIRVLGTSFVVSDSQRATSAVVQVISGRVGVAHEGADMGELKAGKELVYDRSTGRALRRNADSSQAIAWIHKTFSFEETPLESVFAAMESKFGVRCIIRKRNPAVVKLFTGMFSEDDTLKDILLALSLSTGIRYAAIDKTTIEIHYP
ncbi:MAG: FecR domain-containing protein [Chitinophagaceae bacterium]|nr:FecR domain-containing protein [Chitinophagaceae bacterium]